MRCLDRSTPQGADHTIGNAVQAKVDHLDPQETLSIKPEFNCRAGFASVHDRLPEWMTQEPLPPHDSVLDVPEQDLDGVSNW